ncbi:MAG: methyl-accepting chemotaxis protein [Sphingomonadales bacterium]
MSELAKHRQKVARNIVLFIWLQVPGYPIAASIFGIETWLPPTMVALGLCVVSTLVWRLAPDTRLSRMVPGISLIGLVALFAFQFSGHPWQGEIHLYFFVAIAIVAAYCDHRVLIASAATVGILHLLGAMLYPSALFPAEPSFLLIGYHIGLLGLVTGCLYWLNHYLVNLFVLSAKAADRARVAAERSDSEAKRSQEAMEKLAQSEARTRRLAAEQEAARDKERGREAVERERHKAIAALSQAFEKEVQGIIDVLNSASANVEQCSADLADLAQAGETEAGTVAEAATSASDNVQSMAAATEELSTSYSGIMGQVNHSHSIANEAVVQSNQTTASMKSLTESMSSIVDVLGMISEIAEQTNLLALNATIEAARAGEAGKGFSVVANEVKALANQTSKATEEIGRQIKTMQEATDAAVGSIDLINDTINGVSGNTTEIASAVTEQDAATTEIARSAQAAFEATSEASRSVEKLESTAHRTRNAAENMLAASGDLATQSGFLAEHVEKFLEGLRSNKTAR